MADEEYIGAAKGALHNQKKERAAAETAKKKAAEKAKKKAAMEKRQKAASKPREPRNTPAKQKVLDAEEEKFRKIRARKLPGQAEADKQDEAIEEARKRGEHATGGGQ